MRNIIRNICLNVLGTFKTPAPGVHVINAHYLDSFSENNAGENFDKQLSTIKKYGELIKFEEAIHLITTKAKVKTPLVAFSFDDGFRECYHTIAPILENHNINAAFFINPNFVECDKNYYDEFSKRVTVNGKAAMTWAQIKELDFRGHVIGGHTSDHINLGKIQLTDDELNYQILGCKKIIENKIDKKCDMFAFPYGGTQYVTNRSLEIMYDHYKYVFSSANYKEYFSFDDKVINRRHIEPFWRIEHMKYFLSTKKKY